MKSNNCNALSPARQSLTRLPRPSGQGDELVGSVSVARVPPRTSKGITAIHPRASLEKENGPSAASRLFGPYRSGAVSRRLVRHLRPSGQNVALKRTPYRTLRRLDATPARHRVAGPPVHRAPGQFSQGSIATETKIWRRFRTRSGQRRTTGSLYQVVSPATPPVEPRTTLAARQGKCPLD